MKPANMQRADRPWVCLMNSKFTPAFWAMREQWPKVHEWGIDEQIERGCIINQRTKIVRQATNQPE